MTSCSSSWYRRRAGRSVHIAILALCLVCAAGGCVQVRYPGLGEGDSFAAEAVEAHRGEIERLQRELMALDDGVDESEARAVAEVAVAYPMVLANRYELTRPPIWHNLLVNLGIKERGLCTNWTQDLINRLHLLATETLRFHWGVANHDRPLRLEHSTVVVTACGQDFADGIVLDGWRDSGRLVWVPVRSDEYSWKPRRKSIDGSNRASSAR